MEEEGRDVAIGFIKDDMKDIKDALKLLASRSEVLEVKRLLNEVLKENKEAINKICNKTEALDKKVNAIITGGSVILFLLTFLKDSLIKLITGV